MKTETIEGVILAAGLSSRAGAFKMALQLGDKSVLMHVIDVMRSYCSRVTVVSGYRGERIAAMCKGVDGVRVVPNPRYEMGMFTSVKTGVEQVTADWFFFTPGDYPLVRPATYDRLLAARGGHDDSGSEIFIPLFGGRKGHPILIGRHRARELAAEPDDSNLRAFIRRKGFIAVPTDDPGILKDIDTMEDYRECSSNVFFLNRRL